MRALYSLILTVILMAIPASQGWAWGKMGHRVTAQIAEQHLSGKSKREIQRILGVEDIAEAADWPDHMRSSPEEFWKGEASAYHFVTVPKGKTYAEVGAPEQGDAVTGLEKFRAVLKDRNATLEEKQKALRFVVHIVGDLHQPLHAGNGTDRGANFFNVIFFDKPMNLHTVWDEELLRREELSYTELATWVNRRVTKDMVKEWSVTDPHVWIAESTALRDTIYPSAGKKLSYDYVHNNRDIVRLRLAKGGVRLAAFLNETFQ